MLISGTEWGTIFHSSQQTGLGGSTHVGCFHSPRISLRIPSRLAVGFEPTTLRNYRIRLYRLSYAMREAPRFARSFVL